jgi:hypothetical protein
MNNCDCQGTSFLRSAHSFGILVVWHDVVVVRELTVADGADSVLSGDFRFRSFRISTGDRVDIFWGRGEQPVEAIAAGRDWRMCLSGMSVALVVVRVVAVVVVMELCSASLRLSVLDGLESDLLGGFLVKYCMYKR